MESKHNIFNTICFSGFAGDSSEISLQGIKIEGVGIRKNVAQLASDYRSALTLIEDHSRDRFKIEVELEKESSRDSDRKKHLKLLGWFQQIRAAHPLAFEMKSSGDLGSSLKAHAKIKIQAGSFPLEYELQGVLPVAWKLAGLEAGEKASLSMEFSYDEIYVQGKSGERRSSL